MENVIQIKYGNNIPEDGSLNLSELGYVIDKNILAVGVEVKNSSTTRLETRVLGYLPADPVLTLGDTLQQNWDSVSFSVNKKVEFWNSIQLNGTTRLNEKIILSDINYGETLPNEGLEEGQLFFLLATDLEE